MPKKFHFKCLVVLEGPYGCFVVVPGRRRDLQSNGLISWMHLWGEIKLEIYNT